MGREMLVIEYRGIIAVWWAALMGRPVNSWSEGKRGAAPRRRMEGSRVSHGKPDPDDSLRISTGPEAFRSRKAAAFPSSFAVLRSLEAVLDAGQTPAGFHLPAARPPAKGASLHLDPADLPRPALGHQGVPCRHRLPHDGKSRCCWAAGGFQHWWEVWHHLRPDRICPLLGEGFGSRFCPQSNGLVLLKARAQLSG